MLPKRFVRRKGRRRDYRHEKDGDAESDTDADLRYGGTAGSSGSRCAAVRMPDSPGQGAYDDLYKIDGKRDSLGRKRVWKINGSGGRDAGDLKGCPGNVRRPCASPAKTLLVCGENSGAAEVIHITTQQTT